MGLPPSNRRAERSAPPRGAARPPASPAASARRSRRRCGMTRGGRWRCRRRTGNGRSGSSAKALGTASVGVMAERRQTAGGGIDGEPGDAVVAAVADIEEAPRRRQMDLRAGIPLRVPGGQGADRLHGREGARRTVEAIGGDAAALLVGEVDEVAGSDESNSGAARAAPAARPGTASWRSDGRSAHRT